MNENPKNGHKKGKDIHVNFIEDENRKNEEPAEQTLSDKQSELEGENSSQELAKKLEESEKKYEELNEQFLRLRAEFANYKRRIERDQLELGDYIKGEVIKKILPVLDDFKHMLEKSGENAGEGSVLDGARMIYDKLNKILEAEGLSVIDALGQEFDPQIHEAMMIQKTADKANHNKIIGVFQEGYKIKDRLVRPTKVVVGNYDGEEK